MNAEHTRTRTNPLHFTVCNIIAASGICLKSATPKARDEALPCISSGHTPLDELFSFFLDLLGQEQWRTAVSARVCVLNLVSE